MSDPLQIELLQGYGSTKNVSQGYISDAQKIPVNRPCPQGPAEKGNHWTGSCWKSRPFRTSLSIRSSAHYPPIVLPQFDL